MGYGLGYSPCCDHGHSNVRVNPGETYRGGAHTMALRRGSSKTHGGDSDSAGRGTAVTDVQRERLTPELWRQLNATGRSDTDIARICGVKPQTVRSMLNYYGIEKPQTRAQRMWPWQIDDYNQLHSAACEHLRRHSSWMTDGRKGMAAVRRTRLRNFYTMLLRDKVVVEFNPEFPPVRGVSSSGGWAYQPRELRDEELIIRVNTLIVPEIDDEFREFWSIPDAGEWPRVIGRHD